MDKQQARTLIRETFEKPFDKARFITFVRNLLNHIEEDRIRQRQGQYIPDAYKPFISTFERIGKFHDGENRIDILIIKLQKETSLERARSNQRNFVAGYLQGKYGSSKEKDAALVAFVSPGGSDWRFSLVRMDYKFEETRTGRMKVKEEFTPARRWSFLVGANENSHTAQSRLEKMLADDEHNSTLAELEEVFNIETVTREFFLKYRDLFIRAKEALDRVVEDDARIKADFAAKGVNTVDFAKKLLGQITFLYFLQKKGWFGVPRDDAWGAGSKKFLRELFEKKHGVFRNFYNDILEPLFYEALRNDRSHEDHYYSRFDCKIPFLNGGLFDPTGNYDWVHTDIYLPDSLFSNQNKTREGDTGDGILDIFDRYNFTVKEDEPLEKEVAIDPELLGKSYEKFNAIRSDNFEDYQKALKSGKKGDETKFNKQYGVYYTPREIVHYMCRQSLINYLHTQVTAGETKQTPTASKKDIETLIHTGEQVSENEARVEREGRETKTYAYILPESIRLNAELIDRKLANITVCDPAVGSGAFPVGMMSEIVKLRMVLSTFIADTEHRTIYDFKRRCIEHSLYGVDIDPGAVEIAKLRLWLSLVVDEDDIKNIKPLPNLDYKIVRGNSLLGLPDGVLVDDEIINTIEEMKKRYFDTTNPSEKTEIRNRISGFFIELIEGAKEYSNSVQDVEFDFRVHFSEVFHEKDTHSKNTGRGFDVVIGNPPYVQLQKDGGRLANLYKNCNYKTFERTGDIYTLFYENGINIVKTGGHLSFITSSKWMRARYGKSLRAFFTRQNPLLLVDLGSGIFENATVDTNILIVQKADNQCQLSGIRLTVKVKDTSLTDFIAKNKTIISKIGEDTWFIGSKAEQNLKEIIERIGKPLKDWDVNIYRGVLTGLNEAFIIDTPTCDRLVAEDPKSTEILRPILRGRDIRRYGYEWVGLWIIATFPALQINIDNYPAIKDFLIDFGKDRLEQAGNKLPDGTTSRKKTGNKWFETQDQIAYYSEFEKEKVVWIELVDDGRFSYVEPDIYTEATTFLMTFSNPRYLVGILNSNTINWYFDAICASSGTGTNRWKKIYVEKIPIPSITSANEGIVQEIEYKVEAILQAKKVNPKADTSILEQEIDQMGYQLYGLTEEEIKIVEGRD